MGQMTGVLIIQDVLISEYPHSGAPLYYGSIQEYLDALLNISLLSYSVFGALLVPCANSVV